jgi:hypothetical protein
MGRHLLIATVTIEISLFVVSPGGDPLIDPDKVLAPVFLMVVLMAVSQIGLIDRMELGMLSLGAMLVPIEVVLATRDNPCGAGGYGPLLGMVVFAGAAYHFAQSRPLHAEGDDTDVGTPHHRPVPHAPDGQMGVWVDATPETGVWVDTSTSGVWRDSTPDTGTWLDDDYEYDFQDPEVGAAPDRDLTYDTDDLGDDRLAIDDAPRETEVGYDPGEDEDYDDVDEDEPEDDKR